MRFRGLPLSHLVETITQGPAALECGLNIEQKHLKPSPDGWVAAPCSQSSLLRQAQQKHQELRSGGRLVQRCHSHAGDAEVLVSDLHLEMASTQGVKNCC